MIEKIEGLDFEKGLPVTLVVLFFPELFES
jgi:hypothetical protein